MLEISSSRGSGRGGGRESISSFTGGHQNNSDSELCLLILLGQTLQCKWHIQSFKEPKLHDKLRKEKVRELQTKFPCKSMLT